MNRIQIARVARRLAPRAIVGEGVPPRPLRPEAAELLAEMVNDDWEIEESGERVTPEEMVPVLEAARRRDAEEMEEYVENVRRSIRELGV
jgi:hypothetical protein